ncbi:MAG: L-dopachrome tautomerase-related protein [Bradymonadaceae bacterium]
MALMLVAGACSTPGSSAGGSGADPGASARDGQAMPVAESKGDLQVVARFYEALPTGVAVSDQGRIFVSFPRWGDRAGYTVAEIDSGKPIPYPSATANQFDASQPTRRLASVDNLVVGPLNDLWILDTGRPHFNWRIADAAKLVRVDLATDQVIQTIVFPEQVARKSSYLSDVRIDMSRGPEGMAYVTDASEMGLNGLIVVDLATGESWRKLDLHPSTRAQQEFLPIVEGRPMLFDPKGRSPSHVTLGVNGIALAPDGDRVFYRPLASRKMYSVRTDTLTDRDLAPRRVADTMRSYGDLGFASDGIVADDKGRIYMTNIEDQAIVRRRADGSLETLVYDPRLLWPDSLAIAGGYLYITTNQRHRRAVFNGGRNRTEKPYVLFRLPIDAGPVALRSKTQ